MPSKKEIKGATVPPSFFDGELIGRYENNHEEEILEVEKKVEAHSFAKVYHSSLMPIVVPRPRK